MGKGANDLVRNMLAQRASKADVGAVLDSLWEKFQGADGIAAEARIQYDAAKDGSSAKLNMLRTLIEQMGEMEKAKAKERSQEETADVSPEDLAAVIRHFQEQQYDQENSTSELRPAADAGGAERSAAEGRPDIDPQKYQG